MPDDWYEEGSVEDKVEWAEEWGPANDGVNINWLAEDIEPDVRAALARNKNIPIAILEKLAKEDEALRHWLLTKLNLISKDSQKAVSKRAAEIRKSLTT